MTCRCNIVARQEKPLMCTWPLNMYAKQISDKSS